MTISVADIAAKVLARLQADTGTGGLFNVSSPLVTAAYWDLGPHAMVEPYIAYQITTERATTEGFKVSAVRASITISAVVVRTLASATAPMDTASAILARIYGNAAEQGGAPSFGFHRWVPSLASPWVSTACGFLSQTVEGDQDRFVIHSDFEILSISNAFA